MLFNQWGARGGGICIYVKDIRAALPIKWCDCSFIRISAHQLIIDMKLNSLIIGALHRPPISLLTEFNTGFTAYI